LQKNTDWKYKVAIVAGVVAVIASLLFVVKYQNDTIRRLEAVEKSIVAQKTLPDGTTLAESSYVTRDDLKQFAKDNDVNLKEIKKDLKDLNGKVEGIQIVRVYSAGYQGTDIPSTGTTPNPNPTPVDTTNPDPFGYLSNRQELQLNEKFGELDVPFGKVGFSAWKKNPWDLNVEERQYKISNVLGMDEDGRHYVYNKFFIEVDGEPYEIPIDEAKFVEEYPTGKFRFAPRFYAGFDGGAYFTEPSGAFIPNLQLSLFSYGKTKPDPDWAFLGLGAGYEVAQNRFTFVVTPASYNIAHHLPFVNNIFVGPSVSADLQGGVAILLGARFGL
jgi:hypothetical protein